MRSDTQDTDATSNPDPKKHFEEVNQRRIANIRQGFPGWERDLADLCADLEGHLFSVARRHLAKYPNNYWLAMEAVQIYLTRFARTGIALFRLGESLLAFTSGGVRYYCFSVVRNRLQSVDHNLDEIPGSSVGSILDQLAANEQCGHIMKFIDRLPPKQCQAVHAHLAGLSGAEAAQKLGITRGAYFTRLCKGLDSLHLLIFGYPRPKPPKPAENEDEGK